MSKSKEYVRILSIDGGGIRGIIPLSILKYIEQETETPIHKLFDVIGGTSTGGIIALGLNSKNPETQQIYSVQDILDFYVKDANRIFITNNDSYNEAFLSWVRDNIASKIPGLNQLSGKHGAGVFTPEYSGQNIEDFLKEKFGSDIKMSHLSTECDVTVYSYDIENDKAYPFNNTEAATNHYYVWQAARATSAAPTFFSGLKLFNSNSGVRFGISEKSSPALAVHQDKLYMAWRG
ncbi:MAG: patatin-like phospholipase family protein, partial [Coleofasciculus sp.]